MRRRKKEPARFTEGRERAAVDRLAEQNGLTTREALVLDYVHSLSGSEGRPVPFNSLKWSRAIGTTRPALIRAMMALKRKGLIATSREEESHPASQDAKFEMHGGA